LNNKQIGTQFERDMCDILASRGYWVRFIVPDARGAQPFDIIAVKDGKALAIDCKTCVSNTFSINRLEDNQIMAFERWLECGNEMPIICVLHEGGIHYIRYDVLKENKSVKLS